MATGPLPVRPDERRLWRPLAASVVVVESVPFQLNQPFVFVSNSPLARRFGPTPVGAPKLSLSMFAMP